MHPNYETIESGVSGREGSYKNLRSEALLTSEEDFRAIFAALPEIKFWVEPGSGHGLGPVLFAELFPDKKSVGIEFEASRVEVSQALKLERNVSNVHFAELDLMSCDIPDGDTFFLYFPTGMVLDRILSELSLRSNFKRIVAIESHGDLLERLRKECWLKEGIHIPLKASRHFPHAVVFERSFISPEASLHSLSFLKRYLVIKDETDEEWIGECYGLEWSGNHSFMLQTPPRTIQDNQVQKVLTLENIPQHFHPALHFRRLGALKFVTEEGTFEGNLRKIFISPSFKVEISTGQQLEWSQLKKIFLENTLCFDTSLDYVYFPHVV